jgi:hypothetical protein
MANPVKKQRFSLHGPYKDELRFTDPRPCMACGKETTRLADDVHGVVASCSLACDEPIQTMESLE